MGAFSVKQVTRDEQGRLVELLRIAINPLRVRLVEENLPLTFASQED
ncbi:hypothetical protein AB0B56_38810 [Streptosporangium canum]